MKRYSENHVTERLRKMITNDDIFNAFDTYFNECDNIIDNLDMSSITEDDPDKILAICSAKSKELYENLKIDSIDGMSLKELFNTMSDEDVRALLDNPDLYAFDNITDIIGYKLLEDKDKYASILEDKLDNVTEDDVDRVANYVSLYGLCDMPNMVEVFYSFLERFGLIVSEFETPDFDYKEESDYDVSDSQYCYFLEVESLVHENIHSALNASMNPETPYLVLKILDDQTEITPAHTELLFYLSEKAADMKSLPVIESSPVATKFISDVYAILKRAIKESPDRAYLFESLSALNEPKAISFIRGFIEKNPDLLDENLLSEAVNAISDLGGDTKDLVKMFHDLFGSESEQHY